jgi:hypothetical protein
MISWNLLMPWVLFLFRNRPFGNRFLGLPASTVYDLSKKYLIKISSHLKPALMDQNKLARIEFVFKERGKTGDYIEMYDWVQVDEMWSKLTRLAEHYFLTPGKPRPHQTMAHKSHIPQVMFLSAIAHPCWDAGQSQWFNEKMGYILLQIMSPYFGVEKQECH